MNTGENSSGDSSKAETSKTEQRNPHTPTGEADFLTTQANDAKAAISAVLGEVGRDLGKTVDPRKWTEQYPWISLAVAAVGGFTAASVLVPSKEQQALRRLERIERALRPEPVITAAKENGDVATDGKAKAGAGGGILSTILLQGFKTLQPILMSAITGAVTANAAKPDPEDIAAAAGNPPPNQTS
jgi:hypothetical protein